MLSNKEGHYVPNVTFQMLGKESLYKLSTADLFNHKTVVAFSVAGAFANPYSPIQLLGYNEYAEVFKKNGIDEIICIAVNDPSSLAAWAKAEGADQLRFIPDMTGDFTRQLGMLVSMHDKGMGARSWRYSMLVKNGLIEKMFIEQDGFETPPLVSNAETMLNYLNPLAEKPQQTAVLMQMWQAVLSS